jgi:asparagine synthase (glutamine-hydrolysing)
LGYTLAYLFPRSIRLVGRFDRRSYSDWSWLADEFRDGSAPDPLAELGARSTAVSSMSIAQLQATNLPMLLRWEDRNSMAHSIEARVPFLDYRLVEMAVALPDKEKVSGGISKRILRQAMRGLVPDPILDRKDKMGFVTAEPLWATRDLAPRFKDELVAATATLPCILSPKIVDQFDEVVAGKRSFDFRFWRAIVLSRWARCFNVDFTGGHSL